MNPIHAIISIINALNDLVYIPIKKKNLEKRRWKLRKNFFALRDYVLSIKPRVLMSLCVESRRVPKVLSTYYAKRVSCLEYILCIYLRSQNW